MLSSYAGSSSTAGGAAWGRYKRIKSIGSGSYGTVYLCQVTDPTSDDFDEYVAIKTVPLEALGDKEASLAMSEVAILRNLSHPHILRFIDCFIDEEHSLCCVTEYVDGGDLASVIKTAKKQKRYVDAFVVVDMLRQALEGLSYLHSQAVLHRDIKPGNIYVTREGTIKIGDFGVSKLVSESAPHAVTFIGTPFYLCPELCMGEPYSFGADVWALGITAYELFLLQLPFHASNVLALANIISEGNYDKNRLATRPMPEAQRQELLNSCGPDYLLKTESLGGLVSSLVQAMLVNDPLDRPTAHQLLQEFYGISSAPPDAGALEQEHQQLLDELDADIAAIGNDDQGQLSDAAAVSSSSPSSLSLRPNVSCASVRQSSIGVLGGGGFSRASLVAMSRSMEVHQRRASVEEDPQRLQNDADDTVRVGDDDDDDAAYAPVQISATTAPHGADNSESLQQKSQGGGGWASAYGSVYADPHALEKALRDKALLYHKKRQEKLKAMRLEQQRTHQQQHHSLKHHQLQQQAVPVMFHSNAYQSNYPRPTSASTVAVNDVRASLRDPQALKAAKGVVRSLVATPTTTLPFNPPRVHFSDEDEEDESLALKATMMVVAPAASSSGAPVPESQRTVTISVKKLRTDTTSKRLLKRLRAAVRAHRVLHEDQSPSAAEIALWLQARCPESLDETLAALPLPAWHLSIRDGDGDFVSVTSSKEWKQALRDHVERWTARRDEDDDDDEFPPPIELRCDVLTSITIDG